MYYKNSKSGNTLVTTSKGVINMPRMARVKIVDGKYHIMVRSLKEFDLFKEDGDKIKYLSLLKKYQLKFGFKIYAYCLMNNHGHLIIDTCGADISKIMHGINFSYARYFNRKYNRYGPVFQDRFKSKVIGNDRYMLTLFAYIHNNPKDIVGYESNIKGYPFSSLKEYINQSDTFGILTRSFLSGLIGYHNKENRKRYMNLVIENLNKNLEMEIEFLNVETEYQTHKTIIPRHSQPSEVIHYVAKLLAQDPRDIYIKHKHFSTKLRALACLLMSSFCDMSHKEICEVIGNITQSGVSYLTAKGIAIIAQDRSIIDNFIH